MKCTVCGGGMKSSKENHQYKESGLPYVTLVNVQVNRCAQCGETEVEIPHILKLHRAIASALVHKRPRFTGAELRFLRSYLGYSGTDFSKLVGVNASTVSRWENDHEPIGAQTDRLLRLMVVTQAPVRDYKLDELGTVEDTPQAAKIRAEVDDGSWLAQAA